MIFWYLEMSHIYEPYKYFMSDLNLSFCISFFSNNNFIVRWWLVVSSCLKIRVKSKLDGQNDLESGIKMAGQNTKYLDWSGPEGGQYLN